MRLILRVLLLVLISWPVAAQAAWRRAESAHFVVYSEEGEGRLRNRIAQLEDFHGLLVHLTSTTTEDAPNKLHVYVVDAHRELATVRNMRRSVGGFYWAGPEGVLAVVNSAADGLRSNEILFHEYAHHFMRQYMTAAYPAWYVEGFAEFLMTAKLEDSRIDIGLASEGRVYSVSQGPWLPIERILAAGPGGLNPEGGGAYYAQAWLMTHYFFSTPQRFAALNRYLAYAGRESQTAALTRATGLTIDQFTRELRRYIAGGAISYRRMARSGPANMGAIAITNLPASADDLLLIDASIRLGLEVGTVTTTLQRVRAAAARHPRDVFARRTLARAEVLNGDRAAALPLLEALLTEVPNDADLMYLRGRLHLENADKDGNAGEVEQARLWFSRAHRTDPNHYQSLYRFALSFQHDGGRPTENTANAMLLAQQLAPQVTEIRLNAATMQIARGDVDYAEALLRPVMADPHNPELAAQARRMIEEARAVRTIIPAPAPADSED